MARGTRLSAQTARATRKERHNQRRIISGSLQSSLACLAADRCYFKHFNSVAAGKLNLHSMDKIRSGEDSQIPAGDYRAQLESAFRNQRQL